MTCPQTSPLLPFITLLRKAYSFYWLQQNTDNLDEASLAGSWTFCMSVHGGRESHFPSLPASCTIMPQTSQTHGAVPSPLPTAHPRIPALCSVGCPGSCWRTPACILTLTVELLKAPFAQAPGSDFHFVQSACFCWKCPIIPKCEWWYWLPQKPLEATVLFIHFYLQQILSEPGYRLFF